MPQALAVAANADVVLLSEYLKIRKWMVSPMTERSTKVGKRGTVVIPAPTRRRYGIEEGTLLIVAERSDGILLQPAEVLPTEIYAPERVAEFLLSNAVSDADYEAACEEVRRLGLDPDDIEHVHPSGKSA